VRLDVAKLDAICDAAEKLVETNFAVAAEYAGQLRRLSTDNNAFDRLISSLRGDSRVHAGEMREIAKAYLGYEPGKSKSKSAVLQQIVDRQMLEARQTARGAVIDKWNKSW
jgi:hypothetical protein